MEHPEIKVQVVTPYGIFFDGGTELAVIPTSDGEQGVMKGHMPFIAAIYPGQLKLIDGEQKRRAFVAAGYAEVRRDSVLVVCNAAEWAENIDVQRAQNAKDRATERLKDKTLPPHIVTRNRHAIRRANARLLVAKAVEKKKKKF